VTKDTLVQLSPAELADVREIAKLHGITEEEAATRLVQGEIARRVRKRTGKAPAKVYGMKGRK
jgi:plasmid stabilization system protein ParE